MHRLTLTLLLIATTTGVADAGGIRHDRADSAYVALARQQQFDAVAFIRPTNGGGGSGVLVAPDWVLTAAHVVEEHRASELEVVFANIAYRVDRKVSHPTADLALLHLKGNVENVATAERYRGSDELKRTAVAVGFGMSGRGDETWNDIVANARQTVGVKRAGENVIEEILDDAIIQADFDHPSDPRYSTMGSPRPLELEFFPLIGDSGGGLFCRVDGRWVLVGITIAGLTGPAASDDGQWQNAVAYGWISQWHRVSAFNDWIDWYLTR